MSLNATILKFLHIQPCVAAENAVRVLNPEDCVLFPTHDKRQSSYDRVS